MKSNIQRITEKISYLESKSFDNVLNESTRIDTIKALRESLSNEIRTARDRHESFIIDSMQKAYNER